MEPADYRNMFLKSGAVIISIWYFLLFYRFPTSLSIRSPDDFEAFVPFFLVFVLFVLLFLIGSAALFLSKIYAYFREYPSPETPDETQDQDPVTLLTNHYLLNIRRLVTLTVLVVYTNIFNGLYRGEMEGYILVLISLFVVLFLTDILINRLVIGNRSLVSYRWSLGSWISLAVALAVCISLIADFGGLLTNFMKLAKSVKELALLLRVMNEMDLGGLISLFLVFVLLIWSVLRVIFESKRIYRDFLKALRAAKESFHKVLSKLPFGKKATTTK